MKRSPLLLFLALSIISISTLFSQERQNAQKLSFSFHSKPVNKFIKWSRNSQTGEWHSGSSGGYSKSNDFNGAFSWDLISFSIQGESVYALRYCIGKNYDYTSVTDYIYYFISYIDVLRLQNLFLHQEIKIKPYGKYLYNWGEHEIINKYINHEYQDLYNEIILCKYTIQDKQPVIRFTLPYEGYPTEKIFETGPYYEVSYKIYNTFQKSLANIIHRKEFKHSQTRSKLFDEIHELKNSNSIKKPTYDTTDWYLDVYKLVKNNHYYDNQRFCFLSSRTFFSDTMPYRHVSGFYLPYSVKYSKISDTVWVSQGKNQFPYIVIPESDVYKAEYVQYEPIRYFSSSRNSTNNLRRETGFYTPLSCIEGKIFTITSAITKLIIDTSIGDEYEVLLELTDEEGQQLYYSFEFYSYKNEDGYMPLLMMAKIEGTESKYKGKSFLPKFKDNIISYIRNNAENSDSNIVEGNLSFIGSYLGKASNHSEFIHSQNSKNSYHIYYDEPYLQFIDKNGVLYEFSAINSEKKCDNNNLALCDLQEISIYNAEKTAREKIKIEIEKQRQERLERLIKKYGKNVTNDILNGSVRIGWNKEQCVESWGEPKDINRTIGVWGTHEQWVYGDGTYLYFENGILTSIQN